MPNPFKNLYNYLAKAFDKKTDEMDAKRKKWEAKMAKMYPWPLYPNEQDYAERMLRDGEELGFPPCDAKNPYRFL